MPRNETIINVFVASPSDVSEERKALESIIQELNKTWSKNLTLRLDLIKWETDVYPSFGNYPQDVINQQINDDYDVFIAIFWSRLGSKTNIAESGTIEEFNRAYEKFCGNKESLDIMVYFKDEPIHPSKMDFEQLKKLNKLKDRLGKIGGLYWTFERTEDFESLLRSHLSKVAQKWSSKSSVSVITKTTIEEKIVDDSIIYQEEEFGLLDYFEIYEDRMADMSSALSSMAEATEKVGAQFIKRTNEINAFNLEQNQSSKQALKIIKLSGDDIERYAEVLEYQIKITTKSRSEAFDALSKALAIFVDFTNTNNDNSNLESLEESLNAMAISVTEVRRGLSSFRKSLSELPRLTIQLNKSKRRAVNALDEVLAEVEAIMQSVNDVLQIVGELKI